MRTSCCSWFLWTAWALFGAVMLSLGAGGSPSATRVKERNKKCTDEECPEVSDFLPLRPVQYLTLSSLSDSAKYPYAIIRDIRELTGLFLGVGTLYENIKEMSDSGLIEEMASVEGSRSRRTYRPTDLGRAVLASDEAVRMRVMCRNFREIAPIPRPPASAR